MKKTLRVNVFDPKSIGLCMHRLQVYSKWVHKKADELQRRVAELIQERAQQIFDTSVSDSRFSVVNGLTVDDTQIGGVSVTVEDNGDVTLVIASGKDAVFMEFGAGVYYNGAVGTSPHPHGAELGFTIGSYGKGQGMRNVWGFRGEDGQIHLSHGVPASMPMYRAMQGVIEDIAKIAQEVFSRD